MKNRKLKFIGNLAIIAFFLGFPLVGLVYFWNRAHDNIEMRGVEFINDTYESAITTLLNGETNEDISYRLTDETPLEDWQTLSKSSGPYVSHAIIPPHNSYAQEENDKVAQYMEATIQTKFKNQTKSFIVKIRRETVVPRWRYVQLTEK